MLVGKDCLRYGVVDIINDKLFALFDSIKPSNAGIDVIESAVRKFNLTTRIHAILTRIIGVFALESESSETLFTQPNAIFLDENVLNVVNRVESFGVVDADLCSHLFSGVKNQRMMRDPRITVVTITSR